MKYHPPFLIFPLILATGCSTVVHMGHPSGLEVKSRPAGASVFVDGVRQGITPAQIVVEGNSGPHVVRLEKKGYVPQEFTVDKSMSDWVWGNAPFAVFPPVAAAGVGIDATCGNWYRLDPGEIDATLAPVQPPNPTPKPNAPDTSASPPPSLRGDAPEGQGGVHALPPDEAASGTSESAPEPAPAEARESPSGEGELSPPPAAENEQGSPEPAPASPEPEPDDDGLAAPPIGEDVPLRFLP